MKHPFFLSRLLFGGHSCVAVKVLCNHFVSLPAGNPKNSSAGNALHPSDVYLVWGSVPPQNQAMAAAPSLYRNSADWAAPGPLARKAGPFCRTCNRAFSTRGSLNRHMEMHRPFRVKHACHLCTKEFAWPSDLTTHLRISHGSSHTRRVGRLSYTKAKLPPSWDPSLFALLAFHGIVFRPFARPEFEVYLAIYYLFWPAIGLLFNMACLLRAKLSGFDFQRISA